ncbi:hypothetical protein BDY19DRAFT_977432 [Irpex rosettiformis]|uniref:Uncharacterized protein n=1 Tax=Irpex rosettiformis TaxID=378272 RepID=A0ACB8TNK9_9APHY|nr:hypothetical protein BDY19DRAFT_977432 [Irpex rosettiformis]
MPEGPVLKAWAHRLHRQISTGKGLVKARFIFYPRCFAMGTSKKDYVTCTAEQDEGYDSAMDLVEDDRPVHGVPTHMDRERSRNKPWEYLLESRATGEFVAGVLGKVLAVAAGHHLVFINFGLEANVMRVSSEDYALLANPSQDVPGPNKNKGKAQKMRSFAIPDKFKATGSSKPGELRRLNIFLAIPCSDDTVWLFVDHVRLIRFHVFSCGIPWSAKDVQPQSKVWQHAWGDKYGLDWFGQRSYAHYQGLLDLLNQWRLKLCAQIAEGSALTSCVLDVISEDMAFFNGFGKHTAMDLLHELRMLPHMPVSQLIANDVFLIDFRTTYFVL